MYHSPHFHKYFGVLIAVIILAVLVLGVRVGKLSELSATVSLQRSAVPTNAKVLPRTLGAELVANGTLEQFQAFLGRSTALQGKVAQTFVTKTYGSKGLFRTAPKPSKVAPKNIAPR